MIHMHFVDTEDHPLIAIDHLEHITVDHTCTYTFSRQPQPSSAARKPIKRSFTNCLSVHCSHSGEKYHHHHHNKPIDDCKQWWRRITNDCYWLRLSGKQPTTEPNQANPTNHNPQAPPVNKQHLWHHGWSKDLAKGRWPKKLQWRRGAMCSRSRPPVAARVSRQTLGLDPLAPKH